MIIKFKNFINLTEDEKLLVLKWRNSDRIRKNMENKEIIPLENHLKFVDSLKNRNDCKYWLFMLDNTPVGVCDKVKQKKDNSEQWIGGSYIGNEDYLGYGLLLIYLLYENDYTIMLNDVNYKDEFYVMKNNKRTYLMHKNIFGAKVSSETDDRWNMYLDKESWESVRNNLKETIYDNLNIEKVVWEE